MNAILKRIMTRIGTLVGARATAWLLLAGTLAAGAVIAARRPVTAAVPRAELTALSEEMRARGRDYGRGLELIVSGEAVLGRNLLASAADRMKGLAEKCGRTEGCALGAVIDALIAGLIEQRLATEPAGTPEPAPAPAMETLTTGPGDDTHPVVAVPAPRGEPALLRGVDLRDLITLNGAVRAALNDWLTWRRPRLAEAYEHYVFLREDTAPIYARADLPEALLFALIAQETGGKVHAYSSAGAAGPLQFMPITAMRYGLVRVRGFDLRLDPVAATTASAEYLHEQLARFDEDLELALAAYNAGESRLAALYRRHRGATFWDPELYYALPKETRDYVPAVLAAAWLFLQREEYDLELPAHEATATTIELREAVSIGELTVCLGKTGNHNGWFRTLRNLNPRLKGDARMKAGQSLRLPSMLVPAYVERCAGDAAPLARARELHDAAYEAPREPIDYTVEAGDTLATIAGRFGCPSVGRLARVNRIQGPDYEIQAGQRLSIPDCG
jgi:membrane-bound lytic murein transglycosylase D